VELLAKVYDHAKHAYKFGFHMLTLGWTAGGTFIPANSVLLSSENRKNRINDAGSVDKRSACYKRRQLSMGEILLYFTDEMSDITWIQAFQMLLEMFRTILADNTKLSEEKINNLADAFIDTLPTVLKSGLQAA